MGVRANTSDKESENVDNPNEINSNEKSAFISQSQEGTSHFQQNLLYYFFKKINVDTSNNCVILVSLKNIIIHYYNIKKAP